MACDCLLESLSLLHLLAFAVLQLLVQGPFVTWAILLPGSHLASHSGFQHTAKGGTAQLPSLPDTAVEELGPGLSK